MSASNNRLARSLAPLDKLPAIIARRARTLLLRRAVPFVGTARVSVLELTKTTCVATVNNRRSVQNHIGSVHAAAIALAAETATGMLVGMNVPDSRVPVIKSMKVEFKKRVKGAILARASLTSDQQETIAATEKGEVLAAVQVTDAAGVEVVLCEMIWAWTPKRRDP